MCESLQVINVRFEQTGTLESGLDRLPARSTLHR